MRLRSSGVAFAMGALLAGCAVGPDYARPALPTPREIPEAAHVSSAAIVAFTTAAPWDKWWRVFKDRRLDALVDEALGQNQDLGAAIARVHAARALELEARAPLFPTIAVNGQYFYQKQSRNAILVPSTSAGSSSAATLGATTTGFVFTGEPFQTWSGFADMSYELDLWGRMRRGLESASGEERASEADKKNVEITVVADTVLTYFDLGEAEAEVAIAEDAVEIRKKTLTLVRGRVDSGLGSELELRRAEGELAVAQAQLPEAERLREVAEHRLAILTGRSPDVSFGGRPPASFDFPPEVPVGVPSTLIERRPDVVAAEARLTAANARIGQAFAGFFPSVTIAGRYGNASLQNWTISQSRATLFSAGPSVRLPILEGGVTYYTWREQQAHTDEAVATYRQIVLRAFAEVADAISGITAHSQVRERQTDAVRAEERAVELATIEYEQGLTSYLNVLDSQRTLLQARQDLVRAQRQLLSDLVALEKALGGGWSETPTDP
jgi:NodT family efflux transporter outer membrane factor (OMF) lipoprotein